MIYQKAKHPLKGEITLPGDKSISHRSIMLGALAEGDTRITHFLKSADCMSTIGCFRRMDISIREDKKEIIVRGKGLHGLKAPECMLDAGNSGTTMRLLSGILSGQSFSSSLSGDASLCQRPMGRIMEPLTRMGASIASASGNGCAPLVIHPAPLHSIHYHSPLASAQVKSCVLLAGLYADGLTSVTEPAISRDHTERMLRGFGAAVTVDSRTVSVSGHPLLQGMDIEVPGDISSAAYFMAAALLVPGSEILLRNTGINPTRSGILQVLRSMGGDITILNSATSGGEPTADLLVRASSLRGMVIQGDIIPTLIDEIPILAVLAAFADGETIIRDAADLRAKESDRIATVTENLRLMGADVTPTEDGMIIRGGSGLHGADLNSFKDHRIAMSFAVAALAAEGETSIKDADCVNISYPGFYTDLQSLLSS